MVSLFEQIKEDFKEIGENIGKPISEQSESYREKTEASKKRLGDMKKRRRRRRKKRREREEKARKAAEAAAAAAKQAEAESEPQVDQSTMLPSVADVTTAEGSPIGTTSVTSAGILGADTETTADTGTTAGTGTATGASTATTTVGPMEAAISDQERLAQQELRRQRIKRAREKQSLLRRRIERSQDLGAGRRVLSGAERDLNIQTRQVGSGRRRGAGRRSLITGSTGGIGYYSRFL